MINQVIQPNIFNQTNDGGANSNVWATKHIDPEISRGKINISKSFGFKSNTDTNANLEQPASGFAFFESTADYYYATADDRVWQSASTDPNGLWGEVSGTPTDCDVNSDIIAFNSKLYVATQNYLKSYTQTGGFANVNAISSSPHSLCIYGNRLYVSDNNDKVESMSSAESYSSTGSYTIDLSGTTGENLLITKIAPSSNGIWIATTYTDKAGGEVAFWDGVTENSLSSRYKIPRGALAMTIKDDRPYIMDSFGRLRAYDGTTFVEIARLPIQDEELDNFNSDDNDRWIHPNGMITVNDEIYMLISNLRYTSTENIIENLPAGIWAWNPRNGLYLKYSFSNLDITSGTPTDYGASILAQVGAIFRSDATGGTTITRDDQSEILAGIKYYTDATTTKAAIGITDVDNSVKKAGYFVTKEIEAEQVTEAWQQVVALYDKFKNTTDKIIIKYRTSNDTPIYGTGTWSTDSILRSVTDLSSVSNGDEIEILQGKGAGLCSHIQITDTYRMVLDETIAGMSGTCKFRIQNWKKVGEISDTTSTATKLGFDSNASSWIQFKIFMIGTGQSPQLNKLVSVSKVKEYYQ